MRSGWNEVVMAMVVAMVIVVIARGKSQQKMDGENEEAEVCEEE